jgi:hypothetical protein
MQSRLNFAPSVNGFMAPLMAIGIAWLPLAGADAATAVLPSGFTPTHTVAGTAPKQSSLDLSSTSPSVTVLPGTLSGSHAINVGGTSLAVSVGSVLTPAEMVALQQVLSTRHQSLVLGAQGQATGGSFSLGSAQSLTSLVIPTSVTGIAKSSLAVSGNVVDSGTLLGLGGTTHSFTLRSGDLNVGSGGLLTTVVSGALAGLVAPQHVAVDLSVFSSGNISNAGTISSSGKLALTAAGNITNTASGAMSGAQGVSLYSGAGSIANAGTISALAGNVAVNTATSVDLVMNNTGGQVLANAGDIVFRNTQYTGKQSTDVTGGLLSATNLDFNGGDGTVNVNAGEIDGKVNVSAECAHVAVNGGTLTLGDMNVTGDPTFVNTIGDVVIASNILFTTGHPNVAILAAGNVRTTSPGPGIPVTKIDISSATVGGGNLSIVAGAVITPATVGQVNNDQVNPYSVTGFTAQGGAINLPLVSLKTSTTKAGASAGSVTLMAAAGTASGSGNITTGPITATATTGQGGSVNIIGAAIDVLGGVDTHATGGNGGGVNISSATPTVTGGSVTYQDGTAGGTGMYQPAAPIPASSSITIGDTIKNNGFINTSGFKNAGTIAMAANGQVSVLGNVTTSATASTGGTSGPITITSNNQSIIIAGQIIDKGSLQSSPINLTASSVGGDVEVAKGIIATSAFLGGNVTVSANDLINIGFNLQSVNPLALTSQGGITTTGSSGSGSVSLTTVAGDIRVGQGINTTSPVGANTISANAGGRIRIDGPVNASSAVSGSDITLSASGGDALTGIEVKGAITSSGGALFGGNIQLSCPNGEIIVRGAVNSSSKTAAGTAGTINIQSGFDTNIFGAVTANNTKLSGNSITISSTAGMVTTTGGLNSSSGTTAGGTAGVINVTSVDGVSLGGNVLAQGLGASANITIETAQGAIKVKGTINASGANQTSATAAAGSNIIIASSVANGGPALVQITGNVISNGGSTSGLSPGQPGDAGTILIRGHNEGLGKANTGSIIVTGYVSAQGGSTTATFANKPGAGGTIDIEGSTVQIKGSLAGASVNSSLGKGGMLAGTNGTILLDTFGVQTLTTDFNLQNTVKDQPVLPGALFILGNSSVNGSTAALVSGGDSFKTGNGVLNATAHSFTNLIQIDTSSCGGTCGGQTVTISGLGGGLPSTQLSTCSNAGAGVVPIAQLGLRGSATPAEALAVLQVQRGGQTIQLTTKGVLTAPTLAGAITLDGSDFGRPLSAFNLSAGTGTSGAAGLIVTVNQSTANGTAAIDVPLAGAGNNVVNALVFSDLNGTGPATKSARIDFGSGLTIGAKASISIQEAGSLHPNSVTLDFRGSGGLATLNMTGGGTATIVAGNILIRNEFGGLTANLGDTSLIGAPDNTLAPIALVFSAASGTSLNGVLRIALPTINPNIDARLFNSNIALFGSSITVGTFILSNFTTIGPDLVAGGSTSTIVETQSKTSTVIACSNPSQTADINYNGTFSAGTTFTSSQFGNVNVTSSAINASGNISIFTSLAAPETGTFTNSLIHSGGSLLVIDCGQVTDTGGSVNSFVGHRTVTINGDGLTTLNLGVNSVSAGSNVNFNTFGGDCDYNGTIFAGTASSNAPQSGAFTAGVPHSFVGVPGSITIHSFDGVTLSGSLVTTGGSINVVAAFNNQFPGSTDNATLSAGSNFLATGGNISILAGNNATSGTGCIFQAQGFTTGASGGIELQGGTTTSTLAKALATRPVPLKQLPAVGFPGNVQVFDLAAGPSSKGLVDFTGTTVNGVSNTTVDVFKGVVIVDNATVSQDSFFSVDPIGCYSADQSGDMVVDAEADANDLDDSSLATAIRR